MIFKHKVIKFGRHVKVTLSATKHSFANRFPFLYIGKKKIPGKKMTRATKKNNYIVLLFLFTVAYFVNVFSQETNRIIQLQLAQNLEEAGEWEKAATLYEEMYKADPMNYIFLDGLQRSYRQLKEYEKAISVIRRWFTAHHREINLMATLGGLYYDSGNELAADSVWKTALSLEPGNVQSFRVIANEMMQHRLYEQCIRIYIEGRRISNNEVLFADELGNLYAALQQYHSAAEEYLHLIKKFPEQLLFVQSRLSSIIQKPEALLAISEAANAAIKTLPENIVFHRLSVWLLMEVHNYDLALEHYRIIDRLAQAHGNELFNFAQQLNQEHASAAAAKAFKEIIEISPQSGLFANARYGYARALEDLSTQTDSLAPETQQTFQEAIRLYESIAASRDRPDLSAQALFRLGTIKFLYLYDLDGALNAFAKVNEFPNTSNIRYDATLKRGEVQIARNDLLKARKEFEKIAILPLTLYQEQALFKLAELDYFEAQFDTSLSLLKKFDTNLGTDLTNDALQLQFFIEENKASSLPALKEFAQSDLQMRQRKYSESINHFRDIIKQYPSAQLIDDAMMKIGELHLKLKQPDKAIAAFRFVSDSIPLSILNDQAQFRIAGIFENILHDKLQAIQSYEKLLERFPNSLFAEESRKRIRMLRGDIL